MDSMMSVSTFMLAVLFTVLGIGLAAFTMWVTSDLFGAISRISNLMNQYNLALTSWCGYAIANDLVNAYPIGIEVDAEKPPIGALRFTRVVLVVRCGFKEQKYLMINRPAIRGQGAYTTFELIAESEDD
jgi:hypothetical protein